MDNSTFYKQAIDFANQAVVADGAKEWDKALDLYGRCIDHFLSGLKCTLQLTTRRIGLAMAILWCFCSAHGREPCLLQ